MADTDNDNKISQIFREFCQNNSETLSEHEIRRVTFIVLRSKEFPKYFTFRARNDYKEDVVYRYPKARSIQVVTQKIAVNSKTKIWIRIILEANHS